MVGTAGVIQWRPGIVTSAGDSFEVRLFGRGSHGSMPQSSIDPVVMAAATVMRLQTIVSREVAPTVTTADSVGALQAGTKENVIPDEALLKLNVRTFDANVRKRVLGSIKRIIDSEARASGAPRAPEISPTDRYPPVVNDPGATKRAVDAFRSYFPEDRVQEISQPTSASEDFGLLGSEQRVPSVFWFVGGTDPGAYAEAEQSGTIADIPTNHNPRFAPVIHPTLEAGVEALVVAAEAWLAS